MLETVKGSGDKVTRAPHDSARLDAGDVWLRRKKYSRTDHFPLVVVVLAPPDPNSVNSPFASHTLSWPSTVISCCGRLSAPS
jgi:hypothetical protein